VRFAGNFGACTSTVDPHINGTTIKITFFASNRIICAIVYVRAARGFDIKEYYKKKSQRATGVIFHVGMGTPILLIAMEVCTHIRPPT
jgi:hypothetical protein